MTNNAGAGGEVPGRGVDSDAQWLAVRPIIMAWVATDVVWMLILVRAIRKIRREPRPPS